MQAAPDGVEVGIRMTAHERLAALRDVHRLGSAMVDGLDALRVPAGHAPIADAIASARTTMRRFTSDASHADEMISRGEPAEPLFATAGRALDQDSYNALWSALDGASQQAFAASS